MPSSKTQHLTIELRHLCTGYTERRRSVVISPDLSLSIRPGEIVMLMGPNGSGKSTLMHTMAGLLPPLAGEVELGEKPLSSLTMKEVARQLSLVLTERIPAGNMDVWEVVTIGRYPYTGFRGVLSAEDKRICEEALATCRLTELRERIFDTLSDGEKQRVMIARALAQETPLILLDEPTAHLDLPSRLEVTTMLRTLAHKLGKSILISTHELDLALGWADTISSIARELSRPRHPKTSSSMAISSVSSATHACASTRSEGNSPSPKSPVSRSISQAKAYATAGRAVRFTASATASSLATYRPRPAASPSAKRAGRSAPLRGSLPSITLSPHSSLPSESAVHLYINQANNV